MRGVLWDIYRANNKENGCHRRVKNSHRKLKKIEDIEQEKFSRKPRV